MENKWQILVVDDEDMIRTNLQAYLEDENYPVMVAESGEKAVEIVKLGLFTPDVAVVDMRLPNMDGNSVILALNELNPKIKFLIHTGSSEYILPPELYPLGLKEEHVLHKPLADMKNLLDSIAKLMSV